jgi:hypothetical protein
VVGTPVYFNKSKNLRPRDDGRKAGAAAIGRSVHPLRHFLNRSRDRMRVLRRYIDDAIKEHGIYSFENLG